MGRNAVKDEVCAHDGNAALENDLIGGSRVPGIGKVHIVKVARPGDELLGACALLGGAAEEDNAAIQIVFHHIVFQCNGSRVAAGAQQVMAAAMARPAGDKGLRLGASGLLTQSVQRVIFGQKSHNRSAAAHFICGGKGCGNAGDAIVYNEALFRQGLL